MPQISVIVPVYKVEKYLKRCVDSILHQTFSDLEVILVDDGSPDQCPDMCDKYAGTDGERKPKRGNSAKMDFTKKNFGEKEFTKGGNGGKKSGGQPKKKGGGRPGASKNDSARHGKR